MRRLNNKKLAEEVFHFLRFDTMDIFASHLSDII